jgi:hypothetical protein
MSVYKIRTAVPPGLPDHGAFIRAESADYATAEEIARHLSAWNMGHYWITGGTREPLTSFTGGQRDHQATAGTEQQR